jgi:hypothetical protein
MPPALWLALCVYLTVAAVSIVEAEIRTEAAAKPGALRVCLAALCFAAAWPLRAMRIGLGFGRRS